MNRDESLVFFGTGPVAAKTLEEILKHFNIEAVITKPVPPYHKGSFPVHEIAKNKNLKILECCSKQELNELIEKNPFNSKVGLVVDFGIIISQKVIDHFPLGIVNSHFSLLPQWRGADPITFSLLSGQKQTGVSLMLIVKALDEGPLLAEEKYEIKNGTDISLLTNDLTNLSIEMLIKYLPEYINGLLKPYPQKADIKPTYSRMITKEDSILDLSKPAEVLEREVRAFLGWPGSTLDLELKDGSNLRVTVAAASVGTEDSSPLSFKTSKDYFVIEKLKLPGKNEMTAKDFLNGYKDRLV